VTQSEKEPDHGVFIKDITLKELWPADEIPDVQ
jgi:hypothetical protein